MVTCNGEIMQALGYFIYWNYSYYSLQTTNFVTSAPTSSCQATLIPQSFLWQMTQLERRFLSLSMITSQGFRRIRPRSSTPSMSLWTFLTKANIHYFCHSVNDQAVKYKTKMAVWMPVLISSSLKFGPENQYMLLFWPRDKMLALIMCVF